jgi:anti-anti-sigma factor
MAMRLVITEMESPRGLRLAGELDLSTTRELARFLDPKLVEGGDVTLEVSALTFMDSTGLQVLIRSAIALEGKGRVILKSPGNLVRSILDLAIRTDKIDNLVIED